jgi:hypothetical protein
VLLKDESSFKKTVLDSEDAWLVYFRSPKGSRRKKVHSPLGTRFDPSPGCFPDQPSAEWDQFAMKAEGAIQAAAVDCSKTPSLCVKYGEAGRGDPPGCSSLARDGFVRRTCLWRGRQQLQRVPEWVQGG